MLPNGPRHDLKSGWAENRLCLIAALALNPLMFFKGVSERVRCEASNRSAARERTKVRDQAAQGS